MTGNVQISAELTFVRLRGILSYFMDASQKYKIPLAILLAVASRESNMGLSLSVAGTGDHGFGHGIMQVDVRHHPEFTDRHSALDYQANIDYGAGFLAGLIRAFNGEIRPAIAAYNAGQSRVRMAVQAGLDPDYVTTGGDYAMDVLHRMETIEAMMGFSKASSLAVYVIPAGLAV
ncbi:MAG: transglycosylase SLT domain-containing protein, partial [Balneolaceae bacterium]